QTPLLLGAGRDRPSRRRAAEQRDELAASYVEHVAPPRNPLCQLTVALGCTGSAAIGDSDLINVRFGPLCRLKSDISEVREVPLPDSCTAAKPDHSIISSARVSSVAGSSRPSASAVLRLMNSSIFVDCWTGKLASFSSFRTRPV